MLTKNRNIFSQPLNLKQVRLSEFQRLICLFATSLLLISSSFTNKVQAQIAAYGFSASSGTFTELSGGNTAALSGTLDDGRFNTLPIGFSFIYLGSNYSTISATTNGWAALGTTISDAAYNNEISASGTRPLLAPFWDDLIMNVSTNFTYLTTGTAGNQVFTAQWLNMGWWNNTYTPMISFQIKLYEADNRIEFIYRNEAGSPNSITASIGITSALTGSGSYLSLNNSGSNPTPSSTTATNTISSKPATGQIYTFSPPGPCGYSSNGSVPLVSDVMPCIDFPSRELTITSSAGAGTYVTLNVIQGLVYQVYTCSSNPSNQLALTIYREGAPAEPPIVHSYSNTGNTCNTGSNNVYASFTAPFSGQVRILLNRYGTCSATSPTGISLRVNVSGGSNTLDDQNLAGTNQWVGHLYDGTNSGVAWNGNFSGYIGNYPQAETFNEIFAAANTCFGPANSVGVQRATVFTHTYSVRYRMNSTRKGLFVVDLGSDDGGRLAVDGTLVYNNWSDQAFSSRPRVLMSLNGASSLVYDFYENGGENRIVFQNLTQVLANELNTNTAQSICLGSNGSAISGDTYGTLPAGITLSGTGYQWTYSTTPGGARINISGATGASFIPNTSVAPFNTTGTYYIFRNAILSGANNVSPNPYVASNESNAAVIEVLQVAAQPGPIAGNSTVCEGSSQAYSVTNVEGVTYQWVFPADWVISSGNGTSAVNVIAGQQSGIISVTPSAACGVGPSRTLAVTAYAKPAVSTNGNPVICPGTTTAFIFYTITAGNPNAYSIDFDDAANAAGITDINNWSLSGGMITVYVPWNIATGTYNGVLTVYNFSEGCPGDAITVSVIVEDDEPPLINGCPEDFSVYVDGSCNAATATWTPPTVSDNCGVLSFTPDYWPNSYLSVAGSPYTITYTATDNAGNISYCNFVVNIIVSLDEPVATDAQSIQFNSFSANWEVVDFAQNYFLDVSTNVGFTSFVSGYQNRNVGNVSTFPVTGLNANTTYYYRVRAATSCNTSGNSNVILVTTTPPPNPVEVYASEGLAYANYATLKLAFDNINNGTHQGSIEILLRSSTFEDVTAALNESGSGSANYSSVLIYPTAADLSISGTFNGNTLINLNGADNVTIDGRVNATGTEKNLTIVNYSVVSTTNTSTIRFINSAQNNTLRYCKIKGATARTSSGVVFFSTSSAGAGNDNNTITECSLSGISATERPINLVYSAGTASRENSNNTISDNNFYDHFRTNSASSGISLAGLTTHWTITGNSFYETTSPFVPTGTFTYAAVNVSNTSGNGFVIAGNFIGGSGPGCSGDPMIISSATSSRLTGIYLSVGAATASSLQGNTIRNISLTTTNTTPFYGISIAAGTVNIGTEQGNTIGSNTGAGSIEVISSAAAASTYGMQITGAGAVEVRNNIIGAITTMGSASTSHSLYALYSLGAGNRVISNNLIGSETTSYSIHAAGASTTAAAQIVRGIWNASTGSITISENIVANMHNAYARVTTTGQITGIYSSAGVNTISDNIVRDISTVSPSTGSSATATSLIGIGLASVVSGQSLNHNIVHTLTNQYNSSLNVRIAGIHYQNPTAAGSNEMIGNFVHSLNLHPDNSSAAAVIDGIRVIYVASGSNISQTTISNNIISLNTANGNNCALNGIYETGYSSGTSNTRNHFYHNTVYIGGNASGSTLTYAFFNNATGGSTTRDLRNNLFINARTSPSGSGIHYAVRLATMAGVTINYNDYYAPGTGGTIGRLNATAYNTLDAWRTATTQDANSLNIDPLFQNAGGSSPADYYPADISLTGVSGTGVLTDYLGTSRLIPTMGALERMAISKTWKGNISTDFATANNWTDGIVPSPGESVVFDAAPLRHCILDSDRNIGSITNAQSAYRFVVNGYTLTVTGDLIFSNGAEIDATAAGSTVVFSGNGQQQIPEDSFMNNQVQNLQVNNSLNVVLAGTLNIGETFTATTGRLEVLSNGATIGFNGSAAQSFSAAHLMNNKVYNLNINNTAGVALSGNLTVENSLGLNSGAFDISGTILSFINGNVPISRTNGTLTTNAGTSLVFGLSAGTQGNAFTLPSGLFTAAPEINNFSINRDNPLTLSNQMISVRGIVLVSNGVLNTNGNLTLLSSPTQTALIDGSGNGEVLGNVTMQRYLPSGFGYKYVSSPFQNASVGGFASGIDLAAAFPTFYRYNENRDATGWMTYVDPAGGLTPMAGYAANSGTSTAPKTLSLTGNVNNGVLAPVALYNHDKTYTQGFNLMGNPYPSPIDWNAAEGWTRNNIDNAIYYFDAGATDQYTGTYSTYINGISSNGTATNIIASMQGFFVHVSDGTYPVSGSFGMDNRVRVNNLSPAFHKSSDDLYRPVIRLSAGFDDGVSVLDPLVIYFDEMATSAFENELDAIKLNNTDTEVPSFYALSEDGKRLSIGAWPSPDENCEIKLGVKTGKSGMLTFSLASAQNLNPGIGVFLKDKISGIVQNLQQKPDYKVYLSEGDEQSRFALIFSDKDISQEAFGSGSIDAYVEDGLIYVIIRLKEEQVNVSLLNIAGQSLINQNFNGEGHHKLGQAPAPGVYVVTVFTGMGTVSKKILVK